MQCKLKPFSFIDLLYIVPCPCLGESLPLSTGNQITIKFTTVGPETAKGFHFVYQGRSLTVFKLICLATILFIYLFIKMSHFIPVFMDCLINM